MGAVVRPAGGSLFPLHGGSRRGRRRRVVLLAVRPLAGSLTGWAGQRWCCRGRGSRRASPHRPARGEGRCRGLTGGHGVAVEAGRGAWAARVARRFASWRVVRSPMPEAAASRVRRSGCRWLRWQFGQGAAGGPPAGRACGRGRGLLRAGAWQGKADIAVLVRGPGALAGWAGTGAGIFWLLPRDPQFVGCGPAGGRACSVPSVPVGAAVMTHARAVVRWRGPRCCRRSARCG